MLLLTETTGYYDTKVIYFFYIWRVLYKIIIFVDRKKEKSYECLQI